MTCAQEILLYAACFAVGWFVVGPVFNRFVNRWFP